ncbi:hypothetical protein HDV05_006313 [Chytridiales sp. JEL 0842]|nr:hypothetical protein HDV05_006313 [Chytridiales sp. JEL 0842]
MYSAVFSRGKPKDAAESLTNRLKKGRQIDAEMAEYFRERAAIEERYANDLSKLSKKHINVPKDQLGGFAELWDQVLLGTLELGQIHQALGASLMDKVERPLKSRADSDPDWVKQRQWESDLMKAVKEYEDDMKKAKRGDSESKGMVFFKKSKKTDASANMSVESIKESFVNKSKALMDKAQSMDESRILVVKEVISHFATLLSDSFRRTSEIPDRLLAAALNIDIMNEIEMFCSKNGMSDVGASTPTRKTSVAESSNAVRTSSLVPAAVSTAPVLPALTIPTVDAEGFTIRPPTTSLWDNPDSNKVDDLFDEPESPTRQAAKLKVSISKNVIEESSDTAIKTMQSLAASLQSAPTTKRKTTDASGVERTASARGSIQPAPPITSNVVESPKTAIASEIATINGAITETVNVLFKEGGVEKLMLTGDLTLSAHAPLSQSFNGKTAKFTITNFSVIERLVLNDKFAKVSDASKPDTFELDLSEFFNASGQGVPVPILRYQIHVDESDKDFFAPMFINTIWKCEESSASALVVYQHNLDMEQKLNFKDLVFLLAVDGGGEISNVQSKPNGVWNPERRVLMWNVGELNWQPSSEDDGQSQSFNEPHKILARFQTSSTATGGTLQVTFTANESLSNIDLEAAMPLDNIKFGELTKGVKSGKYATM